LIIFPTVSAHVPLEPADNHSLDEAFEVHEPTKSWALYDHIHEGSEAAYYKFDLNPGERAYALVYTLEEGSFAPGLVIMGPGIMSNDTAPDYVEIVNDTGRAVAYGSRPAEAGYEPFTPSSYYYTAEFDQEVDVAGTYYVAVFENETGGKFGIAIGYIESFSASEWLGVPLDVIKIHLWEGQSIFLILAPLILIVIIGLILFYIFQKRTGKGPRLLSHRLGFLAGLIFFGTSAMILMQMLIALGRGPGGPLLWVTFVFAAIPIILGIGILLNSFMKPDRFRMRERAWMMVFAVIGLMFWSGLYIGPALLLIAAILPIKMQGKEMEKHEQNIEKEG
jgi:MFS family permease